MILDLNTTYIHKKTKALLKIVSMKSIRVAANSDVQIEVCEILSYGHKFVCSLGDIESVPSEVICV